MVKIVSFPSNSSEDLPHKKISNYTTALAYSNIALVVQQSKLPHLVLHSFKLRSTDFGFWIKFN